MYSSADYFIGLTHLLFYRSISPRFDKTTSSGFHFYQWKWEKAHYKWNKKREKRKGFEVLDGSTDYGVRQALNQILAMPLTNWLPWRFAWALWCCFLIRVSCDTKTLGIILGTRCLYIWCDFYRMPLSLISCVTLCQSFNVCEPRGAMTFSSTK